MNSDLPKLSLFNSLHRQVEEIQTISPGKISLYTCGPTVYDSSHIGHARSFIAWDVLVRYLREIGFDTTWVRNITDIDDKIITRAKMLGIEPEKLARIETYKFWRDMQTLNIQWPDHEPKATENLPQMFDFIQGLIDKEHAYRTENNDVYFRVKSFNDYGQLKKLVCPDEVVSRIEHQDCKESNADFALWKGFAKDEVGFDSPFGHGRPGWHLECSSMIKRYLGETIDIHGGGEDLVFPHHENEIAQSEALHNKKFANYWIHNGMIMVDGKKMSKSEGNFITIEKALKSFSGNAIRFFVLSAHYRQPVNYTEQALEAAQVGINKLLKSVEAFNTDKYPPAPLTGGVKTKRDSSEKQIFDQAAIDEFHKAMSDDLNTPCALAILFDLAKRINKAEENTGILGNTLAKLLNVLGFNLQEKPLSSQAAVDNKAIYDFLLQQRREARESKDFAKADQIRILIEQSGYKLKDSPQGTELIPV